MNFGQGKSQMSVIRVFGSAVLVHVPKQKRQKWDKKAVKHYLVGYADNVKGYRLYNPVTNKVITSRDVTIMESNSEMVQAVVTDDLETAESPGQHEKIDSSDSDQSISTVISKNDSTYLEEEEDVSNSSDEFHDTVPLQELKNIIQKTELQPEGRKRQKPDRFGYSNMCVNAVFNLNGDQISYEEAISGPESKEWSKAMEEELKSFEENKAWEVVDKPDQATVVKCKWVFKKKLDQCEKVRYRARLVAKGFTQKAGLDYKETFSPVLR